MVDPGGSGLLRNMGAIEHAVVLGEGGVLRSTGTIKVERDLICTIGVSGIVAVDDTIR